MPLAVRKRAQISADKLNLLILERPVKNETEGSSTLVIYAIVLHARDGIVTVGG